MLSRPITGWIHVISILQSAVTYINIKLLHLLISLLQGVYLGE